ncbi:glycosyltransferase family 2 protein [Candidatus Pacearchaeota archaeon]|nr:glycosyltransferase family 2 protein [Candidatus Pacearchaeota archaeon]
MEEPEILIIHLNGEKVIDNCLNSIYEDDKKAKISLLFNQTTDNSINIVKMKYPSVKIYLTDRRMGFAEASNYLVKRSKSKYIIFLNNDTVVSKNWKSEMLKTLKRNKKCIAVQSKIKSYYQRDKFENAGAAGGFIDKYGYPFCRGRLFNSVEKDKGQYNDEIRIFWGCGVSLLVDRKEFIKLGMFDEKFFMYAEELDFCWRANNSGKEIWFCPKSTVYHIGSFSIKEEKINLKKEYLISRNHYIALMKNSHFPQRLLLIFQKTMLEIISLGRFPVKRGLPFLISVPYLAHYLISEHKNMQHHKIREDVKKMIYPRSIALDHFLRGKKTFKSLNFA